MIRGGLGFLGALLLALLTGCAQMPMGAPVPGIDNIQKARASGMAPLALGSFRLAAGKDPALDQRVTIRTNTVYSPYGNSFASYLRETLRADLGAAGLLDAASAFVLEGELLDSQVDVPAGMASARVEARFAVTKSGTPVYDKVHRASAAWPASFVGVEAIPGAIDEYGQLYRKLVGILLDDAEFLAAVRAPPR